MLKTISMPKENIIKKGIVDFFDEVAVCLGHDRTFVSKVSFNCTKICVSTSILEAIRNYYVEDLGFNSEQFCTLWCLYGPKENKSLDDFEIEVESDFVVC